MSIDGEAFRTALRARLGRLSAVQAEGMAAVLAATDGAPLSHAAYMLATAWHETNRTMQPVREAYWLSEEWRRRNLRYWPWYGRGYVQLTWRRNYEKADAALGLEGALVDDADLAMRPDIAARILRRGMDEGWFTGVKLAAILPERGTATPAQYARARTIINGTDRAGLVEDHARAFETALIAGGLQ